MKTESWTRYLVAAALVLLAGAVWALAEDIDMKVEVRSENGHEMTIDVNGVKEIVNLADLAEGEQRVYAVGGHEVTVKRIGDRLTLVNEGSMTGFVYDCDHKKIWIGDDRDVGNGEHRVVIVKRGDGETIDLDVESDMMFLGNGDHGARKVVVVTGDEGEIDVEALKEKYGEDFEEFDTPGGTHVMKWVSDEGEGHPVIIKEVGRPGGGDVVIYRCDETGSILTVRAADDLLEDYIDPVTGCVMKRVEDSGSHVITIRKRIATEKDDE